MRIIFAAKNDNNVDLNSIYDNFKHNVKYNNLNIVLKKGNNLERGIKYSIIVFYKSDDNIHILSYWREKTFDDICLKLRQSIKFINGSTEDIEKELIDFIETIKICNTYSDDNIDSFNLYSKSISHATNLNGSYICTNINLKKEDYENRLQTKKVIIGGRTKLFGSAIKSERNKIAVGTGQIGD